MSTNSLPSLTQSFNRYPQTRNNIRSISDWDLRYTLGLPLVDLLTHSLSYLLAYFGVRLCFDSFRSYTPDLSVLPFAQRYCWWHIFRESVIGYLRYVRRNKTSILIRVEIVTLMTPRLSHPLNVFQYPTNLSFDLNDNKLWLGPVWNHEDERGLLRRV